MFLREKYFRFVRKTTPPTQASTENNLRQKTTPRKTTPDGKQPPNGKQPPYGKQPQILVKKHFSNFVFIDVFSQISQK